MKKIVLLSLITLVSLGCATAEMRTAEETPALTDGNSSQEIDSEKIEDIASLIEIMEADNLLDQMNRVMLQYWSNAIRNARPDVDESILSIVKEEIYAVTTGYRNELLARIVMIYHKYFSHEEIRDLIDFYRTDTGKKTIRIMPDLLRESMEAGRMWADSIMPVLKERLRERLRKEGLDLNI